MTAGTGNRFRDRWGAGGAAPQPLYRRGWVQAVVAAVLVTTVVGMDLSQRSTTHQQASDLRDYYSGAVADLASCAGGLHDALTAMQAVVTGASADRRTAAQIASDAAQGCTPVVDTKLYDLATIGPPPSLTRFDLQPASTALSQWAYPQAATALADVRTIISARSPADATTAFAALQAQLVVLHATAARAQSGFFAAARALNTTLPPLDLDSQAALPGTQQP